MFFLAKVTSEACSQEQFIPINDINRKGLTIMKKYFAITMLVCLILSIMSGCSSDMPKTSQKSEIVQTDSVLSTTQKNDDKIICFCGRSATKEVDVFGQIEHYCPSHYFEVIKLLDMIDPYISK